MSVLQQEPPEMSGFRRSGKGTVEKDSRVSGGGTAGGTREWGMCWACHCSVNNSLAFSFSSSHTFTFVFKYLKIEFDPTDSRHDVENKAYKRKQLRPLSQFPCISLWAGRSDLQRTESHGEEIKSRTPIHELFMAHAKIMNYHLASKVSV